MAIFSKIIILCSSLSFVAGYFFMRKEKRFGNMFNDL